MALRAVVFDVGETLVDETRHAETGDPARPFATADLHEDALPCIAELRRRGLRIGAAGNMREVHEAFLYELVDAVGSSERWGVRKPALAAGMVAIHVSRGSWAHEHPTPDGVPAIDSLDELPAVLG